MKLQKKTILYALIVLALLAATFVLLSGQEKDERGKQEQQLQNEPVDQLVQIAVEIEGKEPFRLERGSSDTYGIREYDDPVFKLDQDALEAAFATAASIRWAQQIDAGNSLSSYGLDAKKNSIRVYWENGESTEYWLGRESPFGDGYYVLQKDSGSVLLLDPDQSALFLNDQYAYRIGELLPLWEEPAREIRSVRLSRGGACVFHCTLRDAQELDGLVGQAYSRYKLIEPVEASTSTYSMENKLLYPLAGLNRGTVIEDRPGSLDRYGLSDPRTVIGIQCDQGEFQLLIGDSYNGITYVMRSDIPTVLAVSDEAIRSLTQLDYLDLINDFFWVHSMKNVVSAVVVDDGEEHQLRMDEGAYTLDGLPISETNATRLFLRMISVAVAGENTYGSPRTDGGQEILFRMDYKNGETYSLSFSPLNERYYLVSINGKQTTLMTNVSDVQDVLRGIEEIRAGRDLDPA